MKYNYSGIYKILSLLLMVAFLTPSLASYADEGDNTVLIMGQVKTADQGYPVIGHKVYIANDSLGINNFSYFKELVTDADGYYYDTITTAFNNGSFTIYTYDPNNIKLDTSVFFRFSESHNDNIFVVNFALLKESTDNSLQASFDYAKSDGSEKFRYQFTDKTACEEIVKWIWTFGDGSISTEQNPSHMFPGPGLYTVSLTVHGYINQELEVNTAYQYLFIPEFAYYHMGGHCFADLFPIDQGIAYLYRVDGDHVYKYDTMKIDSYGYYYFYQVAEGNYYIKLQPSELSEHYGEMIPTYYGDEVFWQDAAVISHYSDDFEYDVHLIEGEGMPGGEGTISGVVTDEVTNKFLLGENTKGVDIYLLNENQVSLACRYTDDNSWFSFDEIALKTYYLVPEITGVPQTKTRITLNEDIPARDEISINVETGEVVLGVDDAIALEFVSAPYPNPVSDQVSLDLKLQQSEDIVISVYDLGGRQLLSQNERLSPGTHKINMNTSGLQNGIYLIRIESGNTFSDQKFVVTR